MTDEHPNNPEYRPAGWYQDPAPGSYGQRWWDGNAWGTQTQPAGAAPPPAKPPKSRREKIIGRVVIGIIAVAGLGVVFSILGNMSDDSSGDDKDGNSVPAVETVADNGDWAIVACHDSVENQLKDPDSADYKNETAVRGTGQSYTVSGMVNAKNSYGGMTGFSAYTCTATLDRDGKMMRATATVLE